MIRETLSSLVRWFVLNASHNKDKCLLTQITEVVNFITLTSKTFSVSSNSKDRESIIVSSSSVFTMQIRAGPFPTVNPVYYEQCHYPGGKPSWLSKLSFTTILFNWLTFQGNKTLVPVTQLCFPGCGKTQVMSHKVPACCGEDVIECCSSEVWWNAGPGCFFAAWGWVSKSGTWNRQVKFFSQKRSLVASKIFRSQWLDECGWSCLVVNQSPARDQVNRRRGSYGGQCTDDTSAG